MTDKGDSQSTSSPTPVLGPTAAAITQIDPVELFATMSLQTGEASSPLERFALIALIEYYCAQQVSQVVSPEAPHYVHTFCKQELFKSVTESLKITGGFQREEFQGVRESILDVISAHVNKLLVEVMKKYPPVDYSSARQPEFDSLGVPNPEGNEVVMRRSDRSKSSDNNNPIPFMASTSRIAAGSERPLTASQIRDGSQVRGPKRPDLVRAVSFDPINRFRLGTSTPGTPPTLRERTPRFSAIHKRAASARVPSLIPTSSAIRPMQDRALALSPALSQLEPPTFQGLSASVKQSRYKTEFTELAFLGKGGFASVYKVRHKLDGSEYAIKQVPIRKRDFTPTGIELNVIFKEIKTWAKLEHKNVVRYYGAWVESASGLWEMSKDSWPTITPDAFAKAENIGVVSTRTVAKQEADNEKAVESSSSIEDIFRRASDLETVQTKPNHPVKRSTKSRPNKSRSNRRASYVSDVDEDGNEIAMDRVKSFKLRNKSIKFSDSKVPDKQNDRCREPDSEDDKASDELDYEESQNGNYDDDEDTNESESDDEDDDSNDEVSDSIHSSTKWTTGTGNSALRKKRLAVKTEKAKKKEARKEVLTLMILMSVHPLTLKGFLRHEGSDSSSLALEKYKLRSPPGVSESEQQKYDLAKQKEKYCWHLVCALKLFKGILRGAKYLHDHSIVHRDLKPGNIFLNIECLNHNTENAEDRELDCIYCHKRCGIVTRIGDFGLVAELASVVGKKKAQDRPPAYDDDILRGSVVGTALYRPPPSTEQDEEDAGWSSDDHGPAGEQARNGRKKNIICEKTDVYALGIILFELLYRFETGSERVFVLMDIREKRILPKDFNDKLLKEGRVDEKDVGVLGRCVLGMTEARRAHRWDLEMVKATLKSLTGWQ